MEQGQEQWQGRERRQRRCCFCCGCRLRTGVLALAWLRLAGALLAVGCFSAFAAAESRAMVAAARDAVHALEQTLTLRSAAALFAVFAVLAAADALMAGLLLSAAHRGKPRVLRVWLMYAAVSLAAEVLLGLTKALPVFAGGAYSADLLGLAAIALAVGVGLWYILAVGRYRTELLESPPLEKELRSGAAAAGDARSLA